MTENNKKKLNRQSTIVVVCGLVLAALATLGVIVVLNNLPRSLGTNSTDSSTSRVIFNQDLIGTWHSKDKTFSAEIANSEIDLRVNGNGGDAVYWYGTFDSNPKQDGSTIESLPVTGKLYLSTAQTKDFTYNEDHISFDFSAAGVTKTVELNRG